jgi:hypothetical protein
MPIIIDNSLLQQPSEEPDDDSAFGYAMMGLVEGVSSGIERQRVQQEEQSKFNREKQFEFEKLAKEQEFDKPLQDAKIAEARSGADLNKVQLGQAQLGLEAERRAAAAVKAREEAASRTRYAEAFGDGDVSKGMTMLDEFDRRIQEAESMGDWRSADRIRSELMKLGEEKDALLRANRANSYVRSVLSSDILKSDEQLRLRADQVLNDANLDPMQRQAAISDLMAEGKRKVSVLRLKNSARSRMEKAEALLMEKMEQETDPEIQAMYQSKISDLHDYLSEWDSIGEDDADSANQLYSMAGGLIRGTPSDAHYRRNGGRSAVEGRTSAEDNFKSQMDELKGFQESGAFTDEQLQPLWQDLLTRYVGNRMASTQGAGPGGGGKDLYNQILKDLTNDGKSDVAVTADLVTGPNGVVMGRAPTLLKKFDELLAQRDNLQDKADQGIATEEELKQLTNAKAGLISLKNKAAVDLEGFDTGPISSGTDYFFRRQLATRTAEESPVIGLQTNAISLAPFMGYANIREDLESLSDQEIRSIGVPSTQEEYNRQISMLRTAGSKIVLQDMQRIGWQLGFNKSPSKSQVEAWQKKYGQKSVEQSMADIQSGAANMGYDGKGNAPLTAKQSSVAAEELYRNMPEGGVAEQEGVQPETPYQRSKREEQAQRAERARIGAEDEARADAFQKRRDLLIALRNAKTQKDKELIMQKLRSVSYKPSKPNLKKKVDPNELMRNVRRSPQNEER